MTKYFLGVDGGQSSTTALIGNAEGRVIAYGRGGPCNHVGAAEGRAKFVGAIEGCISAACAEPGLDASTIQFEAACLGFSGGPADKHAILHEILRCDRMTVTHDALIALAGATAGEPGLIVIGGTGSIAFARNASGKTARAGGWGYVYGDEGSAFDITRQAVRAALRQEEGWGPPTALREILLKETGAANANELLHRLYTVEFPRPKIAAMAKLIDAAEADGDQMAGQILEKAAQDLAMFGAAVRRQTFERGEAARVAYIGGVFRSRRLLARFRNLASLEPGNQIGPPVYGPAAGALIEAYRIAERNVKLSGVPEVEKS